MTTEISTFVACAREVVRSVVPIVLSAAGSSDSVSKKRDGSLVTATDQLVESRVVTALAGALPGIPVLGEEGAIDGSAYAQTGAHEFYSTFLRAPFQLIVDPIDGTRNFVDGRKEYCIAAALSKRVSTGIWPIAAVIGIPCERALIWCNHEGAFREDVETGAISKLSRSVDSQSAISVNSRDRAWLSAEGFALRYQWVSSGSSVYDFIGAAVGRLCGSIIGSQRLWDVMAPLVIAERLGMVLRDLQTGEQITSLCESDLSSDLVVRPWGLSRRMILLPADVSVKDIVERPGAAGPSRSTS